MLHTKCIARLRGHTYDEVYAIVRSMRSPISGVVQLPELAPSTPLFLHQQQLKRSGLWGEEQFVQRFVPAYLQELSVPSTLAILSHLAEHAVDKEIALACYCGEERLCPRSILAGVLNGGGIKVDTESGQTFSHFFRQFSSVLGV